MTLEHRTLILSLVLAVVGLSLIPEPVDSQIPRRIRERAQSEAERRAEQRADEAVDRALDAVEDAIVCVVTDWVCLRQAREEGREVTVTDARGTELPRDQYPPSALRPGEGAWVNYDFIPGERVIFADDFTRDNVGDFPRRLEFQRGNLEVVDWQGERLLRATSDATFVLPLPEPLPERFTLEFDYTGGRGPGTAADRTLRDVGAPYVLCSNGATVSNGATLEIEPGVIVLAEANALLRITSEGVLRAVGTQGDPVRVLGQTEEPGFWRGIWHESGLEGNALEWVEIAHGGGGDHSNLFLSHESEIRIRDSVFRDSEDWGIQAAAAAVALPEFERNEFRGNGIAAARIYPEQLRFIDRASVFEDNAADVIDVRQGTLSGDPHVVPNAGVPYRLYWLDISTDLTLEPGTIFIFLDEHASRVRVRTDGSLDAQGTAEAPIRCLGERPEPGSWGGIWIESDADNVLDHVEIGHGGRSDLSNLMLSGSARVVITNSTFRDGSDYGIAVTAPGVSLPDFSANDLRGNELRAMRINAQHMRYIDTETTASGNGEDVIEVRSGNLEGSGHTWLATDVPFLLVGAVDVRTSLVVNPGFLDSLS